MFTEHIISASLNQSIVNKIFDNYDRLCYNIYIVTSKPPNTQRKENGMGIFKTLFSSKKDSEVKELRKSVNELARQNKELAAQIVDLSNLIQTMIDDGKAKFSEIEDKIPTPKDIDNRIDIKLDTDMLEELKGIYDNIHNVDWSELEDILNVDFDDFVVQYDMEEYVIRAGEELGNELEDKFREIVKDEFSDLVESRIEKYVNEAIECVDFEEIIKDDYPAIVNTIIAQICEKLKSTITK